MSELIRPQQGRIVAGVCTAVANRFGWNITAVRVLTALAVILFGLSIWVYILLWVVIPGEPS